MELGKYLEEEKRDEKLAAGVNYSGQVSLF